MRRLQIQVHAASATAQVLAYDFFRFLRRPHVEFKGPLATLQGREAVVTATSNFMNSFKSLKIRAKFGAGDQAMIVYDVDIPGISKDFPGASLLTFNRGLIVKVELFYDGSRFVEKSKEIFS